MDWIDIGYSAILALGGAVGYIRKGSKISLIAGLIFGSMASVGAYYIAQDPRDVKISLFTAFIVTTVMGVRFKRTKKLMPAGIIAALSLLMILRLVLKMV
ncbi:transmembrane protein 14A [Tiliqua scincoides]|uniref:transmembrane protein 14A n=1 Tax=Tiliqua scincoides TaxID=71010 RepID=UPI0034634CFC